MISLNFPELAQARPMKNKGITEAIFDGEILAYKNERVLPFQHLQKRLHSKNLSVESLGEIPVIFVIFDVLYVDNDCTTIPLIRRKKILANLKFRNPFVLSKWTLIKNQ